MRLSEEILTQITEFAKLNTFTPTKIAVALGIQPIEFHAQLKLTDSEIYRAYHTGRLKAEAEFEQSVQKLSSNGSGPAQSLINKLSSQRRVNDIIDFYNEE
jgi:hypothetical protein